MSNDTPTGAGDVPAADPNPLAENHLIQERRQKLAEWRSGGAAYPNDFRRSDLAGDLQVRFVGKDSAALEAEPVTVTVSGRLMAKRVQGKTSFAVLEDQSGRLQLFLQATLLGEAYEAFKGFDVGDVVGAAGELMRTKTGELSVRAHTLRLLTKSLRPLPDKWHGLSDTEVRYRQRYVDLIVNPDSRAVFERRTRIVAYLRSTLNATGFMEVETPMLQPIPGGAVARPFVTHHNALDMTMYLRIAPELYLKRLVVGGFERVYEINRNFRNEGLSTRHNPEFTMLELYQAYADYIDIMDLVETLFRGVAENVVGSARVPYLEHVLDFGSPFLRISVEDSVMEKNPSLDRARLRERDYLAGVLGSLGAPVEASAGAGQLLMEVFDRTVEGPLIQPTFVHGYPTEVSPLSRCRDADPFLTDRFEFFVAGRELANGFSELNDPEDQAERFKAQVDLKEAGDDEAMYFDADYIRALEYGLPPTGGLGIGIDRLVMLFTNSASIRDVLLFPAMRPES